MSNFQQQVEKFFKAADTDNSGYLERLELAKILKKCGDGRTIDEINDSFDEIDKDRNNKVTLDEVKKYLSLRDPREVTEAELRSCFQKFDKDNSGFITVDELKQVLAQQGLKGDAEKCIDKVDRDNDDRVNCNEFIHMWKSGLPK